jgi:hypothetical protein
MPVSFPDAGITYANLTLNHKCRQLITADCPNRPVSKSLSASRHKIAVDLT